MNTVKSNSDEAVATTTSVVVKKESRCKRELDGLGDFLTAPPPRSGSLGQGGDLDQWENRTAATADIPLTGKSGIDAAALKEPESVKRVFCAYVEDWEQKVRTKNDPHAEARLLQKYSGLVFYDPDTKKTFSVLERNMEFHWGKNNGWFLLGVCVEPGVEHEVVAFLLEIACKLIGQTKQNDVITIHQEAPLKYVNTRPRRENHKIPEDITTDRVSKRARASRRPGTLRAAKSGGDGNGTGDAKEENDKDDTYAAISPSSHGRGYGVNDYYEVDEILDRRISSMGSESAGQVVQYCKCICRLWNIAVHLLC